MTKTEIGTMIEKAQPEIMTIERVIEKASCGEACVDIQWSCISADDLIIDLECCCVPFSFTIKINDYKMIPQLIAKRIFEYYNAIKNWQPDSYYTEIIKNISDNLCNYVIFKELLTI